MIALIVFCCLFGSCVMCGVIGCREQGREASRDRRARSVGRSREVRRKSEGRR
jgi:hypothetical protein